MKKSDWKNIWHLFSDVIKYEKKTVIYCILTALLGGIRPFLYLILFGKIVDLVHAGADAGNIIKLVFITLTVACVWDIVQAYFYENFTKKLENPKEFGGLPLNKKALTMDYEYLEETHVQELRFRAFTKSFFGVAGFMIFLLYHLIEEGVSVIISVIIIIPLFINGVNAGGNVLQSGIWSLLVLLILIVATYLSYKSGVFCTVKAKEILDDYDTPYNKKHFYFDLFSNVEVQKDIRTYNFEQSIMDDVDNSFREIKECERKKGNYAIQLRAIEQILNKLCTLTIYVFTAMRSYVGAISVGNVVTYSASMVQFTRALAGFSNTMGNMKAVAQYASDYYEFISLEKKKYDGTIPVEKRRDNRFQVDFENVSFKYPGSDEYVIKNLNLSFVIGEKMAIVGKNGSGKTTFIKLLCRLYDVTEGCIKLNGIDIQKYNYKEYCDLFAVVFQDFKIFSFPLGENVASSDDVDSERALEALTKAGMGSRMESLSDGLQTWVDNNLCDKGVNFSGGEKQKIAIARAIYKNAPFVIMDDPTAALDPESEYEVFTGFDKMVGNKTALYISHRLASCRFCEDILVFDNGQVVQRGSHEELSRVKGLYLELWNAQAQYYT